METPQTVERPHPCSWEDCDRSFARKSDLARHMRIHLNDRPFACEEPGCGKAFIQRSALTVHLRVHTGEKPHCCLQCGRAFADSSSLARHRRVHTGARPYLCQAQGCARSFCRKTTLIKHEFKVHGIAPPPSPSPTASHFPRDVFDPSRRDHALLSGHSPDTSFEATPTLMEADKLEADNVEEEEEEEEPEEMEDEDDVDYKPTPAASKKAAAAAARHNSKSLKASHKPPPKKAPSKGMSARYNPGTNVTLPPARPHPGLAPAQPFDVYIPPSQQQHQQQQQQHAHFMHMSHHIQSAPNTPLGHRPQYSPVDDFQQHPHTATLPPLSNISTGSNAPYYPTLPPMNVSPGRPDHLAYYTSLPLPPPPSPPASYAVAADYTSQSTAAHPQSSSSYTVSPHLHSQAAPMMLRHHSFSGPFYGAPQHHQHPHAHHAQQLSPHAEPRSEQAPRTSSDGRRLSLPHDQDNGQHPQAGPSLAGYHELEAATFSPSSSMGSAAGAGPEPAYALHPGSPSVSPSNGYLSPHFTSGGHYMPPSALHHHHHPHQQHPQQQQQPHQPYVPQSRMVYVGDVSGMPDH